MSVENESSSEVAEQPAPDQPVAAAMPAKKPKKGPGKGALLIVLILLLALGGAGAYYMRDKSAKDDKKKDQAAVTALQQKVTDLEAKLAAEKAKADADDATKPVETPAATVPSAAMIANIKAVFASGNSAALEGYMASTVKVVFAASEGLGDRTPAQATADITSFMSSATDPWSFPPPAATLTGYQTGDYAAYFPANAVVGKSNEMVISFTFNSAGKISGVLMTPVASVL